MWERDGKMYHIQCRKGDIGKYVLLPGDPFRTDLIASYLEEAKLIAYNREHKTWTGTLLGERFPLHLQEWDALQLPLPWRS